MSADLPFGVTPEQAQEIGVELLRRFGEPSSDPGRLRALLSEAMPRRSGVEVWQVQERGRLILGVCDAEEWFAGPPWEARPDQQVAAFPGVEEQGDG